MRIELDGRARLLGDDVNTDYIIASSRKKETLDPHALKRYMFESIDPAFAATVRPGDLLVAGRNFGCGSAMEVAVTVLLAAGIRAVLARSFARTYYRNAINNGLTPIECDTGAIREGARVHAVLDDAGVRVLGEAGRREIAGRPLPSIVLDILREGGLVPYFRLHHDFGPRD
ncbi:MAG TPA: 3-isopropylmalate dehydratase [Vicinamibacterales bacterium]|jgi:3-isopropylmalate/(R)-2-methylmalate dehydratase small subunit